MDTKEKYKSMLLKGVEYGTQTLETLTKRKMAIEAKYANDPVGLAASQTYRVTCEVLTTLQQQQVVDNHMEGIEAWT